MDFDPPHPHSVSLWGNSPFLDNVVDFVCFTGELEYSFSSADIVINMIKILFFQNVWYLLLFIYSLFISIGLYSSSIFKSRI